MREGSKQFKYVGENKALFYVIFYSHLVEWLTHKVVPDYVAPNVITITGFIVALMPLLCTCYAQGLTFEGEIPTWVFYLQAGCF